MRFFEFNQNSSGGLFSFDEKHGITHVVIIEAKNADDANEKLEDIGGYFDGCNDGRDCPCCGDRWHPLNASYDEGEKEPLIYGKSPNEYVSSGDSMLWMDKGKEVAVHYSNGKIEWF